MDELLNQLRQRIDRIDEGLVDLLSERMECSQEIVRYKKDIRDEAREQRVLERIQRLASGRLGREHAEAVFRRIIQASVEVQMAVIGRESKPRRGIPFKGRRVAVIGTGRMGSWLVREMSRQCQVAAYDLDDSKIPRLEGVQVLHSLNQLQDFNPDILFNSVSLERTEDVFSSVLSFLQGHCILSDIMSVKGSIREFYEKEGRPFLSFHPMFGPGYTDMADLSLENAVIIHESDRTACELLEEFLVGLGISVHYLHFHEHDTQMAKSLTLPFAASIVFSAAFQPGTVSGTTFARHRLMARRLFMEDFYLLAEVLFNRHSLDTLKLICSSLEYLKQIVDCRDYELAAEYFANLRKKVCHDRT